VGTSTASLSDPEIRLFTTQSTKKMSERLKP
jgi:hypothetical protein